VKKNNTTVVIVGTSLFLGKKKEKEKEKEKQK